MKRPRPWPAEGLSFKDHIAREQEIARFMWYYEHLKYKELAPKMGLVEQTIRGDCRRRLGFQVAAEWNPRAHKARYYVRGPCVICLNPFDREELDEERRCDKCQPGYVEPEPNPIPEPEVSEIDVAAERRAYLNRRKNDG